MNLNGDMQDTLAAPQSADAVDEGLIRGIGVWSLAANCVNLVVGSGIFILPAVIAAILGPAAILAYIVCAAGIGLITLCYAELGSRVTRSGGTYAYIEAAFGPFIGFLAGFLMWFGADVISSAAVAVLVVDSFLAMLGLQTGGLPRAALLIALFASLAAANIRGVRTGARLVEILTVAKLAPLILLILVGLYGSAPENVAWTGLPSLHDVGRATLILVFAFTGTEAALNTGGEIKSPRTTIPRAVVLALIIVTTLYIGVHLAAQGLLGGQLAFEEQAPLAAAGARVLGPAGRQMILAATLISTLGFLTGAILAVPRMLFAFARDGSVPRVFGAVHPRFRTPYIAIATHSALACAFALTGTFSILAVLTVVPTLVVFLGCCAATLMLRRKDVEGGVPRFRIPGGPVVPIAGSLFVLWLLSTATRTELLVVAGVLALAAILRAASRRHLDGTVTPSGAVQADS